jgi:aconitate hydratase
MDGEYHRWLVDGGNCEESITIKKCERSTHAIEVELSGEKVYLNHGSIVIAAITSCTNTSNPSVMVGAGLLAKKAVERGLKVKPYIKTSLAPGSRVVVDYLKAAGLLSYLEMLGFYLVGFGCTTCIGNSGPLAKEVVEAVKENELVVAAVLSGNRNFEGRIHSLVKANYLASPPLVIAYALAGSVNVNLKDEPIGHDPQGRPIYLQEIWPQEEEIQQIMKKILSPEMVLNGYLNIFEGTQEWKNLGTSKSPLFKWDPKSTYIREPPFFTDFQITPPPKDNIVGARVLALLDDSITTDHISPAGAIPLSSPAGQYLISHKVTSEDFNSYGSRRGNHEVMMRGTFGNIRLRNHLVPGKEGGWTRYNPTGEEMTIYDAAMLYQQNNIPLLIIAGKEYGTGSSRDWAAKGTRLLGVKAVIAESYERIHRGNLIGMGVLPLQFKEGKNATTLNIKGDETFDIKDLTDLTPKKELEVTIRSRKGEKRFPVLSRLDTQVEIKYYLNDGILHTVLRNMLKR